MIGFIFALISAIGYSLNQIFSKKLLKNKLNDFETTIISKFFLIFLLGILVFFLGRFDLFTYSKLEFTLLIISSFIATIGFLSLLKSFKYLKVSEALSIANIYPFIILLLSFMFFKEIINLYQFLTMIIVFVGIVFLIKSRSEFKLSKNYFYPIITSIGWGLYGFIIFYLVENNKNVYSVIFNLELFILLFTIILSYILNINIDFKKGLSKNNLFYGFLVGFTTIIGSLFYGLSTNYIQSSIASSISSTQILFATIFSIFILNEKISKKQYMGVIIISIGLILFNLVWKN